MLCIAAHYNISVYKYRVKKELRDEILKLKIVIPSMSTQPRADVSIDEDGERVVGASFIEQKGRAVLATPRVDKFSPEAPPATLPRFEAFSPGSFGSFISKGFVSLTGDPKD